MKKGLIIPVRAIPEPLHKLSTELVDQFQYELNSIFKDPWFIAKHPTEREAFLFAGISTEGGEIVDCYKKGKLLKGEMDVPHLLEELGDLMWHISTIATKYNLCMSDVMKQCMTKFRERWPARYMEETPAKKLYTCKDCRRTFEEPVYRANPGGSSDTECPHCESWNFERRNPDE